MASENKLSIILVVILAIIIAVSGVGAGYYFYQKALKVNAKPKTISTDIKTGKDSFTSVLFGKDKYELSYNKLPIDFIEVISNFEFGDKWEGKGFWDSRIFAQGNASLALNVANHNTEIVSMAFPEKKKFSNVKFVDYYINLSDIQVLESHVFKLGDEKMENYYSYTVTNLKPGWNLVRIPMEEILKISNSNDFTLDSITRVQLEVLARFQHSLVANFDKMKIFRNSEFQADWLSTDNKFLSLDEFDGKVSFMTQKPDTISTIQATLANISGLNDFEYEAKVSPQTSNSEAGLFFRGSYKTSKGYYFMIGGVNSNTWTLRKYTDKGWENILNGELSNLSYDAEKFYWLRVAADGDKIKLFFSLDGVNFTQTASVNDATFLSGGVGVALFNGSAYFDDFKVRK